MSNCEHTKQSWLIAGAVLLLVALDQALKLYIRTHFVLGEAHEILPFAKRHSFTQHHPFQCRS